MPEAAAVLAANPSTPLVRTSRCARCPDPTPLGARALELPPYDLAGRARARARARRQPRARAGPRPPRAGRRPARARAFLDADERHDPRAFAGIDRAVAAIERHIARGRPDRRARRLRRRRRVRHRDRWSARCARSGRTSAGICPSRIDDGYGLSLRRPCARLAGRGTGLLVTVDCGITAVDEVAAARAAGLDVVVTRPPRAARATGGCPTARSCIPPCAGIRAPDLCGTAVAYKLAQALGAPTAEDDLELVALATVADLMPLRGENRRLVREGLAALSRTVEAGPAGADDASRSADPERARRGLARVPAGAADQRRRAAAPRRRRPRAAADRRPAARRARSRPSSTRVNAERRAVEQRIVWEAEAQVAEHRRAAAVVRARRRGLAPRGRRDRRLADRRAPPPPGGR